MAESDNQEPMNCLPFLKSLAYGITLDKEWPNKQFDCGFCGRHVSSVVGTSLQSTNQGAVRAKVYVCPNCLGLNSFLQNTQYPSPALGRPVDHVPPGLSDLYEEARRCTGEGCYTAAVLLCRKMLMNIAVQEKAQEGLPFISCVEYLANNGFVPPNGKIWVDHIRKKGNEATHEIAVMKQEDANDLRSFIEMLLRFIYEFPALISKSP
jgi:transcription elongation factor Elf1